MKQDALSESINDFTDAGFSRALALHKQSRLAEAEVGYVQVLDAQPHHLEALTFLGVIAFQQGQFAHAVDLANRALTINPQSVAPRLIHAHSLAQLGQKDAAVASYDLAIESKPDLAEAYLHRANLLQQLGRHPEALASYDGALALNSTLPEFHNDRGNCLSTLKRFKAAVESYDRALALAPEIAEVHFNRGLALYEIDEPAAALASFDRAIKLDRNHARAHLSRGTVLNDLEDYRSALASYDRAIEIKNDYAQAYANRGNVLVLLEQLPEALASYATAISISPTDADVHCNRGNVLASLARHAEALESFERALAVDGEHAQSHYSRSFVYLLLGRLVEGWRAFEWRWKNEHCITSTEKRNYARPVWLGDGGLNGKTILLHCEQGLGDTIQFCRYAELVARLGANVIIEAPQELHSLLGSLRGVKQVVVKGGPLLEFDCYCPLLSLPLAFKTDLKSIPSLSPYLSADVQRLNYWRARLGEPTQLRVGLVWAGGFRADETPLWKTLHMRRNIPLSALASLRMPGVEFYSLQKGDDAERELASLTARDWSGPKLMNYMAEVKDFGDTAALLAQLDLLISVDTATAHLAGAIGTPVWILNRYDTCWRWLLHRSDSPWYPTARLYRQTRRGDWHGVVQQVREDLERLVRGILPQPSDGSC